jgi:antitoxin component YwqK of YwqJK toxin-antitoxin module
MNIRVIVLCAALSANLASAETEYRVQASCASGLTDGQYLLYSGNSVKRVAGTFSQGKKNGPFSFFRSSGEQTALVPFRMDQIDGVVQLWFGPEAGARQLKLEATYAAGKLHGAKSSWYPDGSRRSAFHYTSDNLDGAEAWKPDGTPLSSEEAAAMASRDTEADRRLFDVLFRVINENLPKCNSKN